MKAKINDRIETLIELQAEFSDRIIPAGAIGTVIECYTSPEEGYAVDMALPNQTLLGEADYENIILYPNQFRVISNPNVVPAPAAVQAALNRRQPSSSSENR